MKFILSWVLCFIFTWVLCFIFGRHRWTVSKATGLNRHTCSRCGQEEFKYG